MTYSALISNSSAEKNPVYIFPSFLALLPPFVYDDIFPFIIIPLLLLKCLRFFYIVNCRKQHQPEEVVPKTPRRKNDDTRQKNDEVDHQDDDQQHPTAFSSYYAR
jgi:hypothetical protein